MRSLAVVSMLSLPSLFGCGSEPQGYGAADRFRDPDFTPAPPTNDDDTPAAARVDRVRAPDWTPPEGERATAPDGELRVHFLGVMGFVLQHGRDVVMSAPLFTREGELTVSSGQDVSADLAAIDNGLAHDDLTYVSAILSGHAHYDHLMDVPRTMTRHAPASTLYANMSAKNILRALDPERPQSCEGAPLEHEAIDGERVVAVDDPLASVVDYTNCPDLRPEGAPLDGSWVYVPGSRVRIFAMCGMHPDQFLFYHFAVGRVGEEQCELPPAATSWREGTTVTYLVDFLDDDGAPVFRVYYQDAPSDGPIGHPPAHVLADKPVDLALLCVGTFDQVRAHPEEITAALAPRFGLSGHWEDFFSEPEEGEEPRAIPFMDLDDYVTRADAVYPGAPDAEFLIDGLPSAERHVLAQPDARFVLPRAP